MSLRFRFFINHKILWYLISQKKIKCAVEEMGGTN